VATRNEKLRSRFGRALREARLAAALSQEELADRAGLHVSYISQLERGLKSPSLDSVAALAQSLDTTAAALVAAAERR